MHKRLLFLTFCTIILNSLLWVFIVPLWHFPDEQAHFGQVAYMAETGNLTKWDDVANLTNEIYTSEVLLGTHRDALGNNKFTFHPDYKIPYSDNFTGLFEASISAMAINGNRTSMIKKEAAVYPYLYYLPGAIVYKLFYYQDLFVRVFSVRFWSIMIFLANIFFVYRLGKTIFAKDKLMPVMLTVLVGFQPMMVFADVGVNSDTLGNLLFTVFLFLCSEFIIRKPEIKEMLYLIFIILISIYIKPQFILLFPMGFILMILVSRKYFRRVFNMKIVLGLFILTVSLLYYIYMHVPLAQTSLIIRFMDKLNITSLVKYTAEYTIPHTYREVMPWYWGVYDWLGVTYPRMVHRLINWVVLISLVGFCLWVSKSVGKKLWHLCRVQTIFFLGFILIIYFIGISFYDWYNWYSTGYPLGVQGRYFFPLISVISTVLLIGWKEIMPVRFKNGGVKLLGIMMVVLNIYALYIVSRTYYDISSFNKFIIQVSQYKPLFVKNLGIIVILIISAILYISTIISILKIKDDK